MSERTDQHRGRPHLADTSSGNAELTSTKGRPPRITHVRSGPGWSTWANIPD